MPTDVTKRFAVISLMLFSIILLVIIVLASDPAPQDNAYHQLADRRAWLGIPNFLDIASNLPFAIVGLSGLSLCLREQRSGAAWSWPVFFGGLLLIACGSTYYHWRPSNATLLWDRMPMTISFMSLLTAVLAEHGFSRLEKPLLPAALLLGVSSVLYWRYANDLRFYGVVQFGTLLAIPIVVLRFKSRFTLRRYLLYGLLFYASAKTCESNDREIFLLTGQSVSGHTLKHLLAAAATYCVYRMLKRRSRLASPRASL